jgi:hypothetical protein
VPDPEPCPDPCPVVLIKVKVHPCLDLNFAGSRQKKRRLVLDKKTASSAEILLFMCEKTSRKSLRRAVLAHILNDCGDPGQVQRLYFGVNVAHK